ncbi:hypothetical protein L1887_61441 [Cichorium endivia]|nr:hypothetical protein L1887_61441 [Cichorium endivia]
MVGMLSSYIGILHSTWFVNSAAHLFGDRPYNKKIQPRNNFFVNMVAMGEESYFRVAGTCSRPIAVDQEESALAFELAEFGFLRDHLVTTEYLLLVLGERLIQFVDLLLFVAGAQIFNDRLNQNLLFDQRSFTDRFLLEILLGQQQPKYSCGLVTVVVVHDGGQRLLDQMREDVVAVHSETTTVAGVLHAIDETRIQILIEQLQIVVHLDRIVARLVFDRPVDDLTA